MLKVRLNNENAGTCGGEGFYLCSQGVDQCGRTTGPPERTERSDWTPYTYSPGLLHLQHN